LYNSVLDDTETGRKLKGALGYTSQFIGEKSRQADKVLGQAKKFSFYFGHWNI
jgi:hypothetical protein